MMKLQGGKCYRAGELVAGTVFQRKPYGVLLHLEGDKAATALVKIAKNDKKQRLQCATRRESSHREGKMKK